MNITVAVVWVVTALVSFLLAAWLGKLLIPVLHRLKFGQTIREEGPAWHKSKQGTPTMGGVIFIAAMLIVAVLAMIVCQFLLPAAKVVTPAHTAGETSRLFAGLILAVGFGVIGFLDDFIKVVRKRNLGLTSRQKMLAQLVVSGAYAVTMVLTGTTKMYVPFVGFWEAGIWFIPVSMFIIVAITNATNLTDGVDGLCGTVSVVALLFLLALCGTGVGYGIITAAMAGALVGFLVWNLHPAQVFMGDTGSLFIGGVLCAVAFGLEQPFLLVPLGIVYVAETLSVVLQVSYFKITHGKRLFKMSPLHHHFEMCGWSENKIVTVFSLITAVGGAVSLLLAR